MSEASPSASPEIDEPGFSAHTRRTLRKTALTVLTIAIPVVVYFLIPLDNDLGSFLAIVLVVATAASLIPISIRQAQTVLRSADPLFDAMRSIVSALVFLVIAFASAYYVLGTNYDNEIHGIETKLDAIYFTVTVLATVGFGDITADGQMARGIVTGQMVINFAVLAVSLRVVSWALKERGDEAFVRRVEQPRRTRS